MDSPLSDIHKMEEVILASVLLGDSPKKQEITFGVRCFYSAMVDAEIEGHSLLYAIPDLAASSEDQIVHESVVGFGFFSVFGRRNPILPLLNGYRDSGLSC